MRPKVLYLVTRQDEGKNTPGGGPLIPSLGHPTSVIDLYRTVGVQAVENKPPSWCFTDIEAASALGRIIDGPINSGVDLDYAESALRAILLHEYTEVLVPCVKASHSNGFFQYLRPDNKLRNDATFSAFRVANSFDRLFATEFVTVSNGRFTESSNSRSTLIDTEIESFDPQYSSIVKTVGEMAHAFPTQVGATTSFANPKFQSHIKSGPAGFIDELYSRVYRPWHEVAQSVPTVNLELKLPPLLAIVLSRAPWREQIPEVLWELRQEMAELRSELNRLNAMIDSCMSQAELFAQQQKVNESFDAIVPESLLTQASLRKRRVFSIFNLVRRVRQLYSIAADPLAADPDEFFKMVQGAKSVVATDSRIVSRSIPAATMAELLRVPSIRETIKTHFTAKEVDLISER